MTEPKSYKPIEYSLKNSDLTNGEYIYLAAGCSSCHITQGSKNKLILAGGQKFETPFGRFIAPNISNSVKYGIGSWEFIDFYNALKLGQSPEGQHYYPAFPYTSYSKMKDQDIKDLWTFWKTLPSSETPNKDHELPILFDIRRNIGVWKKLYVSEEFVSEKVDRAAYIVEALAHCAECHTPRNLLGALKKNNWFQGAQDPSGKGRIPSIKTKDLRWTKEEIVEYLNSGFTPDYDVVGGKMASVVENISQLSLSDKELIAEYLLRLK
ncbi:cytochrome c [Paracoccaceae bacterium]|nr:cytochrome c [Paracoccaceae bacterium]